MARNGWSYLVVTDLGEPHASGIRFQTPDGFGFASEDEMFRELGTSGWELVSIRDREHDILYYFKRPRT